MWRIIAFGILAALIIWGGIYVNQRLDQRAETKVGEAVEKRMEGFIIEDIVIGNGMEAKAGDTVRVHYLGTFPDDAKFDSSYDRGEPFTLILGAGSVIEGWEKGLIGMKVGGKRKLTIPPSLAYGERGYAGVIPPNATLHFEIELLEVK